MQGSQLLQLAMAEAGCLAQKEISGDIAALAVIGLTGAERLSAIAGVIASVSVKRHSAEQARFLQQLQDLTRLTAGAASVETGLAQEPRGDVISAGTRLLDTAFDRLAERLAEAGVAAERAAAVECVLIARLLAGHRPHRIRLALLAAACALADPDYQPGGVVPFVPAEGPVAAPGPLASRPEAARTGTFG